jgi:hypothetical protein
MLKKDKKILINLEILIILICVIFFIINYVFYKYIKNNYLNYFYYNKNIRNNNRCLLNNKLDVNNKNKLEKIKSKIEKKKKITNNYSYTDNEFINNNYSPFISENDLEVIDDNINDEDEIEREIEKPIIHIIKEKKNDDIVKEYDRTIINDNLEAPLRRVPRHVLHPPYFHNVVNIPTRGYPDNYRLLGLLINITKNSNENKILQLFGRETYPSSSRYEYYTSISADVDRIKIPIYSKNNKELYDGDIITISELGDEYKIQLHKIDHYRYNPYLI